MFTATNLGSSHDLAGSLGLEILLFWTSGYQCICVYGWDGFRLMNELLLFGHCIIVVMAGGQSARIFVFWVGLTAIRGAQRCRFSGFVCKP